MAGGPLYRAVPPRHPSGRPLWRSAPLKAPESRPLCQAAPPLLYWLYKRRVGEPCSSRPTFPLDKAPEGLWPLELLEPNGLMVAMKESMERMVLLVLTVAMSAGIMFP